MKPAHPDSFPDPEESFKGWSEQLRHGLPQRLEAGVAAAAARTHSKTQPDRSRRGEYSVSDLWDEDEQGDFEQGVEEEEETQLSHGKFGAKAPWKTQDTQKAASKEVVLKALQQAQPIPSHTAVGPRLEKKASVPELRPAPPKVVSAGPAAIATMEAIDRLTGCVEEMETRQRAAVAAPALKAQRDLSTAINGIADRLQKLELAGPHGATSSHDEELQQEASDALGRLVHRIGGLERFQASGAQAPRAGGSGENEVVAAITRLTERLDQLETSQKQRRRQQRRHQQHEGQEMRQQPGQEQQQQQQQQEQEPSQQQEEPPQPAAEPLPMPATPPHAEPQVQLQPKMQQELQPQLPFQTTQKHHQDATAALSAEGPSRYPETTGGSASSSTAPIPDDHQDYPKPRGRRGIFSEGASRLRQMLPHWGGGQPVACETALKATGDSSGESRPQHDAADAGIETRLTPRRLAAVLQALGLSQDEGRRVAELALPPSTVEAMHDRSFMSPTKELATAGREDGEHEGKEPASDKWARPLFDLLTNVEEGFHQKLPWAKKGVPCEGAEPCSEPEAEDEDLQGPRWTVCQEALEDHAPPTLASRRGVPGADIVSAVCAAADSGGAETADELLARFRRIKMAADTAAPPGARASRRPSKAAAQSQQQVSVI